MDEQLLMIKIADRIPDEAAAYEFLEELRWGQDNYLQSCPHCDAEGLHIYINPANGKDRLTRTGSRSQRRVWKCRACRKQFSVLTGTIFHGTKIPIRKWIFVIFEMCSNKNGVAAREIERRYDLTAKSAWYMLHRIREAMKRDPLAGMLSGTVVADETWIGGKPKNKHAKERRERFTQYRKGQPETNKTAVLSLVDKRTGEVRSQVVRDVTGATLEKKIAEHVDMPNTVLHTDGHKPYQSIGTRMAGHEYVSHHLGEYVRDGVSTNLLEGFFSQLKRSIDGTHHKVSSVHLDRYLQEFDFRYSTRMFTDTERMQMMMNRTGGRRLSYVPLTGNT